MDKIRGKESDKKRDKLYFFKKLFDMIEGMIFVTLLSYFRLNLFINCVRKY